MERIFFHKTKSGVFEKTVLIVVGKDLLLILLREGDAFVFVFIFPDGPLEADEFQGKAAQFGKYFREIGYAPFFSKPLWGGKILGFSAPSLKDIVNIGVSIAVASIPSGNIITGVLLNTIDDAVFTGVNVATGNMTWDEGLFSIGQAGLCAVVGAQIGGAFNGLMVADPGSIADVVGNTLVKGMEKVATNVTVGAINSFEYRSGGAVRL